MSLPTQASKQEANYNNPADSLSKLHTCFKALSKPFPKIPGTVPDTRIAPKMSYPLAEWVCIPSGLTGATALTDGHIQLILEQYRSWGADPHRVTNPPINLQSALHVCDFKQPWWCSTVSVEKNPCISRSTQFKPLTPILAKFSCSVVSDSTTPWTAARQASLSITNSQSLLKLMSIESVMPSNHPILCHTLLLPPSIFPSIRVFSNESVLHIRWPNYWSFSFSISPSNEYSGLISIQDGFVGSPCCPRDSEVSSPILQFKSQSSGW